MWISQLNLRNIRSFESADLHLSRGINVIIGPNNSGKSTILRSLLSIQDKGTGKALRKNSQKGAIRCAIEDTINNDAFAREMGSSNIKMHEKVNKRFVANLFEANRDNGQLYETWNDTDEFEMDSLPFQNIMRAHHGKYVTFNGFSNEEPGNLFYPYFSNSRANTSKFNLAEKNHSKSTLIICMLCQDSKN